MLGSPFKVPVEDVIDASKVKVHGAGVNPEGVRATQAAPFTVDCRDAGKAPLKATVDDGKYFFSFSSGFCVDSIFLEIYRSNFTSFSQLKNIEIGCGKLRLEICCSEI